MYKGIIQAFTSIRHKVIQVLTFPNVYTNLPYKSSDSCCQIKCMQMWFANWGQEVPV